MTDLSVIETLRALVREAVSRLPQLLAALLLVFAGWVVASLLRRWTRRLVTEVLERFGRRAALHRALEASGTRPMAPRVIGAFAFWLPMLLFTAAAVEVAGLPVVTGLLNQLASYLPRVIGSVVIVFGGLIAATFARNGIYEVTGTEEGGYTRVLAQVIYWTIVVLAAGTALDQFGIDAQIPLVFIAVVFGTTLAGAALGFGLGSRDVVASLIGAHYADRMVSVGQRVRIDDLDGRVIETTPTSVVLETAEGTVYVPAAHFVRSVALVVADK